MSNALIIGEKLAFSVLAISILYFITNIFKETNVTKIISLILRIIAIILVLIIFGLIIYHFWTDVYPRLCNVIGGILK